MKPIGTLRNPNVAVVVAVALAVLMPRQVQALPANFSDQPITGNWNQSVGITFASDGRMFVWEKAGLVWIVENGAQLPQPLIDISDEVGNWRDYGLLGFAVDPNFYQNGYIYLLYVVDYYYLLNAGTPSYDPQADWYYHDTIARLTRYTANAGDGFHSVNPASRHVLIGESITTGLPICHQSHGIGTVRFGSDGTLLLSCGDGASYESVDTGTPTSGSSNTCLIDGIIRPKEDVGAYRAQVVDSLSGKILRVDAATGDGVPGNPFFDPLAPRAPRSRVWAMGVRNPFRFTVRPGTGSGDPAAGDPGTLYIGDVGWYSWEELLVCKAAGRNFGWPAFEGMEEMWSYWVEDVENLDAPNPLFGTTPPGQGFCAQQYFYFRNLIIQDTLAAPSFPNPCDPNQQIPTALRRFVHTRAPIDWGHGGPARAAAYNGNDATWFEVGQPGSPVDGPQFAGNCSVGGAWYTAAEFPAEYQNTYFHADFGAQWIRNIVFDAGDNPVEIRNFGAEGIGALVDLATSPADGALYYISYDAGGCCSIRSISYVINVPPQAVAAASPPYGPEPLAVQFDGSASVDPDGDTGDLVYEWDFGDGTPVSRLPDPLHVYPSEDITDQGSFVGMIFSLNPPHPTGGGNWDPEVMRDGDYPPVGNQNSSRQFDTYHGGAQGNIDWIGYSFPAARTFSGLVFQEGRHFGDGGWFDSMQLQVRSSGIWTQVSGLVVEPPYPGNNGISYETFEMHFTPQTGDAIRLYGNPGGSANFISVGELRVVAVPQAPLGQPTRFDATLTVRDALGSESSAGLSVYVNNTPPSVAITSPPDGFTYPPVGDVEVPLTADISDAEYETGTLACQWQTVLHHNNHTHPEPLDFNCSTTTVLSPHGSENETFYYAITLMVTDPLGLSASDVVYAYPETSCVIASDCTDTNACTADACTGGFCSHAQAPYGDLNADSRVDLLDVLCVLDGFAASSSAACPGGSADITPCIPDGVVDLLDILGMLDAYQGAPGCACP